MYLAPKSPLRRWTPRLLLVIALALGWWRFRTPPLPEDLVGRVDALAGRLLSDGPAAGVAVGIARGGRIVLARGYGEADLEHGVPVSRRTVFHIGSLTKQFTAAGVLRLAGQGSLSLEDPIRAHLPELPPEYDSVTIAMLLSHTSGVPDYPTMERWWETAALEVTPARLVESFVHEPLNFAPDSEFSYSNSAYALLGLLIERLTGRPYGGYLNESLFGPLGLGATRYCDDRIIIPDRARGYEWVGQEYLRATYVSMSQAYAAGGLCSTVEDLLSWTHELMSGRIVGEEGTRAMTTPARLGDGTGVEYGYGLAIGSLEGRRQIGHVGGTLGFSSHLAHYPDEDLTVVVLTNTQDAPAAALAFDIARYLLEVPPRSVAEGAVLPDSVLARYEGRYDLTLTEVTVRARDGLLHATAHAPALAGRYTLRHETDHRFRAEGDPEVSVLFEVDGEGRVSGLVLEHRGISLRGRPIRLR